ncbi:MAG: transposase [Planctomycetes bacterium]|nr:transposase [Planctomycetota bacterium]
MPQSLARIWVHVVFSTKDRRAYLQHEGFRTEMFRMIGHYVNEAGCIAVRAGGWHDHIHFVCGLSRTVALATLIEKVKVETSRWAKDATNGVSTFSWQAGYGAFSISQSNLPIVIDYVDNQATHHRQRTFQDEFRELCQRHELDLDEHYAWD